MRPWKAILSLLGRALMNKHMSSVSHPLLFLAFRARPDKWRLPPESVSWQLENIRYNVPSIWKRSWYSIENSLRQMGISSRWKCGKFLSRKIAPKGLSILLLTSKPGRGSLGTIMLREKGTTGIIEIRKSPIVLKEWIFWLTIFIEMWGRSGEGKYEG